MEFSNGNFQCEFDSCYEIFYKEYKIRWVAGGVLHSATSTFRWTPDYNAVRKVKREITVENSPFSRSVAKHVDHRAYE